MVISLVRHKHATLSGHAMMISTFWGEGWVEIISQSILSHLFFNSPGSWRFVWRRGGKGELAPGFAARLRTQQNKNARFANYFLLLILETPQGKTPYKRNNQAWPVFIKFWRIPQVEILFPHGYQNSGNVTNTKTWNKCTEDHCS